ncbi:MAG: hypothetical protein M3445_00480 [Actinomycetota bacterium]|nr:hypothetical protein [Actinomycetota bacterium]
MGEGTEALSTYVSSGMNPRLTALIVCTANALALSSCSSARQVNAASWQSPDLDAKSYYDDYEQASPTRTRPAPRQRRTQARQSRSRVTSACSRTTRS